MLVLGPRSRAALVAGGIVSFALAYATTPLVAGSATVPLVADAGLPLAAAPVPTPFAAVLPHRDPFVGAPDPQPSSAPVRIAAIPTVPPLPTFPAAIGPLPPSAPGAIGALPPNAGAIAGGTIGPLPGIGIGSNALGTGVGALGAHVTAVVTGPHPYALVEEPGGTRIVAPGDIVDGERVTAITTAGVRLAHGTTLTVAPTSRSTAIPPAEISPAGVPRAGFPPAVPATALPPPGVPTIPVPTNPVPLGGLP